MEAIAVVAAVVEAVAAAAVAVAAVVVSQPAVDVTTNTMAIEKFSGGQRSPGGEGVEVEAAVGEGAAK